MKWNRLQQVDAPQNSPAARTSGTLYELQLKEPPMVHPVAGDWTRRMSDIMLSHLGLNRGIMMGDGGDDEHDDRKDSSIRISLIYSSCYFSVNAG